MSSIAITSNVWDFTGKNLLILTLYPEKIFMSNKKLVLFHWLVWLSTKKEGDTSSHYTMHKARCAQKSTIKMKN